MKYSFRTRLLLAAACCATLFTACNKDNDSQNGPGGGKAQIEMRLTDGPGNYDAVWLDIREVEIITNNGTTVLTPLRPGLYDLLRLNNGVDTLLLSAAVPAGTISQIRLLLGERNSVVVDGTVHPLNTPSAQESGLKLNLQETILPGGAYTFWLDFDAGRSILRTGNGQYKLKPVIRAYTAQTNGQIEGYVLPYNAGVIVYATNGNEIYSAIPAPNGYYRISGLPAGTYQVTYDANLGSYQDVTLQQVSVSYGVITNTGTTTLLP